MTAQEVRCFLSRYKLLNDRVIAIEKTLYDVKPNDFNYVKGYSNKTINDTLLEKDQLVKEMEEINQYIKQIKDLRNYYALNYKYIQGLTIEKIGEVMNYSDTQVRRFLKYGINELVNGTNSVLEK